MRKGRALQRTEKRAQKSATKIEKRGKAAVHHHSRLGGKRSLFINQRKEIRSEEKKDRLLRDGRGGRENSKEEREKKISLSSQKREKSQGFCP